MDLGPISRTLGDTLGQEADALDRLDVLLGHQLAAVQAGHPEQLDALALETSTVLADVQRLRAARERQARLLSRMLKLDETASFDTLTGTLATHDAPSADALRTIGTRLRERAASTRRHTETLGFALRYASGLGREILQLFQGNASGRTYNSKGAPQSTTPPRSFLNHVG